MRTPRTSLGQLATQFLGSDRSRLVIVPGNHDVDWNRSRASMLLETPDLWFDC